MKFSVAFIRASLVCLASLSVVLLAHGQADQSQNFTPPLAIYQGSNIDTVSHPMENVHLSIPLLHLKGRGLDLDINATYNSNIWSTTDFTDANGNRFIETAPKLPAGWGVGVSRMGSVTNIDSKCIQYLDGGACYREVIYGQFEHT